MQSNFATQKVLTDGRGLISERERIWLSVQIAGDGFEPPTCGLWGRRASAALSRDTARCPETFRSGSLYPVPGVPDSGFMSAETNYPHRNTGIRTHGSVLRLVLPPDREDVPSYVI